MNPMPHASSTPWLLVLLFVLGAVGCIDAQQPQEPNASSTTEEAPDTVVDVLTDDDRFATLVTALDSAGLTQTLREEGPYTVFAPTDSAFAALPAGTVQDLLLPEHRDRLTTILAYHVAEGTHAVRDVQRTSSLLTIEGDTLSVAPVNGTLRVGEVPVVEPDLEAGNGVVHVIDAVLLPPPDEASS